MSDPKHAIELAVNAKFKAAGLSVKEFDIGHYPENINSIALDTSVNSGKNKRITNNVSRQDIKIRVLVVLKHLKGGSEEIRRELSLPIITAIEGLLQEKKLGLDIDPISPDGFTYKTSQGDYLKGFIVWEVMFSTFIYIKKVKENPDVPLLSMFIDYFLQDPIDDEIADASDLINFEQDPEEPIEEETP